MSVNQTGVMPAFPTAFSWYRKAAAGGNADARGKLRQLGL